ncbi:ABC transporter family substrate-binding protein [Streptomyces ficellus]|uniref:ABC transporter family substrate-binding protein n=1 Tax=Streptomyces ficellus TaxID=1977088 RepID=A0ABT7Z4Y3_9ACTN|nr:ABC transporter family substrate-binding protein [Streptomyces ficellus]MDN3294559.1 ABC transporter family substrate-binding protein [Streptomyces ficellus]
MSHVGAPRGRTCSRGPRSRTLRSAVLLTTGVLAVSVLSGCSSGEEESGARAAAPDIAPAARAKVADGGTLRWAVEAMPTTLNAFQADADATTARIAQAVLPSLFTLDDRGRPQRNPDYLESAEIVEREPKQVVLYKLNQQAVWTDGREIGASDFVAQWRALSGKNSAYWTARNAGYERIEKIERGASDLEVRVTFNRRYADWRALFSPLYPKDVMGTPAAFNDGARTQLKSSAGPFQFQGIDTASGTATLVRNPRWWGQPAKLDSIVLSAVPHAGRATALARGTVHLAEIDRATADRIALAVRESDPAHGQPLTHGPGADVTPSAALKSWALAYGSDPAKARLFQAARQRNQQAIAAYAAEQKALRGFVVRKSLEPAYTQLAMNGESGPLSDERVRRAVARALNRQELAETVLKPLGLPAQPVGSHLALAGQPAYADSSGALGSQDTEEAQALLADAGWTRGGARKPAGPDAGPKRAGAEASAAAHKPGKDEKGDAPSSDGLYIVGDDKPSLDSPALDRPGIDRPGIGANSGPDGTHVLAPAPAAAAQGIALLRQAEAVGDTDADKGAPDRPKAHSAQSAQGGGVPGAYAPRGTAAPAPAAAAGPLGKDGESLTLRFVLPSGPGSESLRAVGEKISGMLDRVGISTEITKVPDESYFKDHIASGDYDLALYSWPATAYPATDGRPIFAKPQPAGDGSLLVEQNYTRVGTDHIDQLFDQAAAELDENAARELVKQADARIWAAAGSIPLYQRPQLVAARTDVVNAGAFGFATPRYEDIGFTQRPKK